MKEDKEESKMNFWGWAHLHPVALVVIVYLVGMTVASVIRSLTH